MTCIHRSKISINNYIYIQVRWIPVMTEEGLCHTLNSVYAEYQFLRQEEDWEQQELLKCHYHSGQCYVRINTATNVARVSYFKPIIQKGFLKNLDKKSIVTVTGHAHLGLNYHTTV